MVELCNKYPGRTIQSVYDPDTDRIPGTEIRTVLSLQLAVYGVVYGAFSGYTNMRPYTVKIRPYTALF